jgi:hypothetical protein
MVHSGDELHKVRLDINSISHTYFGEIFRRLVDNAGA